MTTECECNAAEGYEWALLPAELQSGSTPPTVPQDIPWYTSMFETGSSYLNAALTTAETTWSVASWTLGWWMIPIGLALLFALRPRKQVVHNHYHRGTRRAGLKR